MASLLRRALFAAAGLALLCAVAAQPPAKEGDWITGRATFFSAPAEFKQACRAPSRALTTQHRVHVCCLLTLPMPFSLQRQSQHEFGHLYSGACEYTNVPPGAGVQRTDADVAFPIDEVAALGENSPDFKQGPCGRCYEVRCRTGNVLWDYNCRSCTEQLGGTLLGDVTPDWKDYKNRSFPGYPDARSPPYQGHAKMTYAQCWDESAPPIFVRVIDICPCNRPPQQGGRNQACCTTAPHIDLSYWAFEKLAHPLYGDMTIQFRPVDCNTRQPLASSGLANATSGGVLGGATSSVYDGEPQRGWGITSNKIDWLNLTLPASGLSATSKPYPGVRNATCAQISGAGGLFGFYCVKCRDVFTDAIKLSIRDAKQQSGDPTGGAVPPLRVVVSKRDYNATGGGGEVYCDAKPQLSDAYKTGSSNGYTQCVRRALARIVGQCV